MGKLKLKPKLITNAIKANDPLKSKTKPKLQKLNATLQKHAKKSAPLANKRNVLQTIVRTKRLSKSKDAMEIDSDSKQDVNNQQNMNNKLNDSNKQQNKKNKSSDKPSDKPSDNQQTTTTQDDLNSPPIQQHTPPPKFTDAQTEPVDGFLTNLTFSQLNLCEPLQKALDECDYSKMSEIQAKSIPAILGGLDVLAQAKTGSGKTLAFLVPCIELLHQAEFKARNGTGAIVISPTRELAIQIYNVARELLKHTKHSHALLIGGGNKSQEDERLFAGANLIVATPGRLLDHLLNTDFVYKNLKMLVLDEADRILDVGFEEELKAIIGLLPRDRQSMLFSATQTTKVADVARVAIRRKPIFVSTKDLLTLEEDSSSTAEHVKQGYIVLPTKKKLMLLISFLKRNKRKKILVFFSTCDCVRYFADLLTYMSIPVLQLHGKLSQRKRTQTFFEFCNAQTGTLFSTNVAARGLDIPKVDWIIQFDPPHDTNDYIHRVGRTARAGRKGRALLLLSPEQRKYLYCLKEAKVPLNEMELGKNMVDIQEHLEEIISSNYYLHEKATRAFQSLAYSYKNYSDKTIFNMKTFDARGLATQLGLRSVPFIKWDERE